MLMLQRILVSPCLPRLVPFTVGAALLAGLAGCGQRGELFLPADPAAAGRATLPESLRPGSVPAANPPPVRTP